MVWHVRFLWSLLWHIGIQRYARQHGVLWVFRLLGSFGLLGTKHIWRLRLVGVIWNVWILWHVLWLQRVQWNIGLLRGLLWNQRIFGNIWVFGNILRVLRNFRHKRVHWNIRNIRVLGGIFRGIWDERK